MIRIHTELGLKMTPLQLCHKHSQASTHLPLFPNLHPHTPHSQVRELREVFNAYLEQISAMEGADAEDLVVQALGAVDALDAVMALQRVRFLGMWDGKEGLGDGMECCYLNLMMYGFRSRPLVNAISHTPPPIPHLTPPSHALPPTLHFLHPTPMQDVSLNQQELAAAAPPPASSALPPPAAAAPVDLIGLDDLSDALTASAIITPQSHPAGGSTGAMANST